MFWFLMAAAAASQMSLPAGSGPGGKDVRGLFAADDFPAHVQIAGIPRVVGTRTTVRPDGTVESCVVDQPSGDEQLDGYTCALIVKRARLSPAKWMDGSASYGVIRVPVSWYVGESYPPDNWSRKQTVPDLELWVSQLPKRAKSFASVMLMLSVDEAGKPLKCASFEPLSKRPQRYEFPELVPIACQQVLSQVILKAPLGADEKPKRSIQSALVYLSTKASGK